MENTTKITVCGNVFKSEVKTVVRKSDGQTVLKTTMKIVDADGRDDSNAKFYTVEGFEKSALVMSNFKVGDLVYVRGNVVVKEWEDETGKHEWTVVRPFTPNTIVLKGRNGRGYNQGIRSMAEYDHPKSK